MNTATQTKPQTFTAGRATGILLEDEVHILKSSTSRYHLVSDGFRRQYACQCGGCDCGLSPDVSEVVLMAKEAGATKVVMRTAHQKDYYHHTIHGLPISNVEYRVGNVTEDWRIIAAW